MPSWSSIFCLETDLIQNIVLNAPRRSISVFVHSDVDALCCAYLFRRVLCDRLLLHMRFHVVDSASDLRSFLHGEIEELRKGAKTDLFATTDVFLFINIGLRLPVWLLFPTEELQQNQFSTTIFVLDNHRPIDSSFLAIPNHPQLRVRIVCSENEVDILRQHGENLISDEQKKRQNTIDVGRSPLRRLRKGKDLDDDLDLEDDSSYAEELTEELDQVTLNDDESRSEGSDDACSFIVDGGDDEPFYRQKRSGEYVATPSSLLAVEALRGQSFDQSTSFFVASIGIGSELLTHRIRPLDYEDHVRTLFARLKERHEREVTHLNWSERTIRSEQREPLIPLVRFATLDEALRRAPLFVRLQAASHKSVGGGMATQWLAHIRVELELTKRVWHEQFRLLPMSQQKKLLRTQLPNALSKVSHRLTFDEMLLPVFCRTIEEPGFPDRITNLDMALILSALLSQSVTSQQEAVVTSLTPLPSQETQLLSVINRMRSIAEAFAFGLKLIDWLTLPDSTLLWGRGVASGVVGPDVLPWQQRGGLGTGRDESTSLFAYLADCQAERKKRHWESMHTSLIQCVDLTKEILQRVVDQVILLLAKREGSRGSGLRRRRKNPGDLIEYRSAPGIEAFLDTTIHPSLLHPLPLNFIASLLSDCISTDEVAPPEVLLLSSSCITRKKHQKDLTNGDDVSQLPAQQQDSSVCPQIGLITGYRYQPDARNPNEWGPRLYSYLVGEKLADMDDTVASLPRRIHMTNLSRLPVSGVFPAALDGSESTVGTIPAIYLSALLEELFPVNVEFRPERTSDVSDKSDEDEEDSPHPEEEQSPPIEEPSRKSNEEIEEFRLYGNEDTIDEDVNEIADHFHATIVRSNEKENDDPTEVTLLQGTLTSPLNLRRRPVSADDSGLSEGGLRRPTRPWECSPDDDSAEGNSGWSFPSQRPFKKHRNNNNFLLTPNSHRLASKSLETRGPSVRTRGVASFSGIAATVMQSPDAGENAAGKKNVEEESISDGPENLGDEYSSEEE